MADFFDRETANASLSQLPNKAQVALAVRCALRALPGIGSVEAQDFSKRLLHVLRALLNSSVAVENPDFAPRPEVLTGTRFEEKELYTGGSHAMSAKNVAISAHNALLAARAKRPLDAATSAVVAGAASAFFAADSSASSSNAATGSAASNRAYAEADKDCRGLFDTSTAAAIFLRMLWDDGDVPNFYHSCMANVLSYWENNEPSWGFWKRWYEGMLHGNPMPRDLQKAVALVPNEVWDAGPKAVADAIREIEEEFDKRIELDGARLSKTVSQILKQPVLFRDAAESTGQHIQSAIGAYKVDFANSLPIGFRALEKLPPVYANISQILDRGTGDAEKEALRAEIKRLHGVISELERTLRQERAAFRSRLLSSEEAAQARSFGERLQTTLTCITLLGGLGMGTAMFFGWDKDDFHYEALKAKMQGFAEDLKNAKASPVVLEHDSETDGPKFEKPPEM